MNALVLASTLLGVLVMLGTIGTVIYVLVRGHGTQQTVELLSTANAELRAELADAKTRHSECERKIARLEGELEVLVGGLAERLVDVALKHATRVRAAGS